MMNRVQYEGGGEEWIRGIGEQRTREQGSRGGIEQERNRAGELGTGEQDSRGGIEQVGKLGWKGAGELGREEGGGLGK